MPRICEFFGITIYVYYKGHGGCRQARLLPVA